MQTWVYRVGSRVNDLGCLWQLDKISCFISIAYWFTLKLKSTKIIRHKCESLNVVKVAPRTMSGPTRKVPVYTPSSIAHANLVTACKYQTWAQKQWHISINTHPLDYPERSWTWELTVIRPFLWWTWWLLFQVRQKLVCVKEDNITTERNKPEGNLIYYMP